MRLLLYHQVTSVCVIVTLLAFVYSEEQEETEQLYRQVITWIFAIVHVIKQMSHCLCRSMTQCISIRMIEVKKKERKDKTLSMFILSPTIDYFFLSSGEGCLVLLFTLFITIVLTAYEAVYIVSRVNVCSSGRKGWLVRTIERKRKSESCIMRFILLHFYFGCVQHSLVDMNGLVRECFPLFVSQLFSLCYHHLWLETIW